MVLLQVMTRLYGACRDYEAWKSQNSPNLKPWRFPEQIELPRVKMSEIGAFELPSCDDAIDEANAVDQEPDEEDITDVLQDL